MAFGANRRRAEVLQSFRLDLLDPANKQLVEMLQACPWGTLNQTIVDALRIGAASMGGKPSTTGRSGRRPGQRRQGRITAASEPAQRHAGGPGKTVEQDPGTQTASSMENQSEHRSGRATENTSTVAGNTGAPGTTEGGDEARAPGPNEGRGTAATPGPTQELADSAPQRPTTHQKVVGVDPTRAKAKAFDIVKKLTGKSST